MDNWDQVREQLREEVVSRFPPERLLEVQIVWQGSSDPESQAAQPNVVDMRLIPRGPEKYNRFATTSPGSSKIPEDVYHRVVHDFWHEHESTLKQLARDLKGRVSDRLRVGVAYGGFTRGWIVVDSPLTPVMARLDRTDLETLDALIAAGCAPNRADAIRWALARVRERPAYQKLVEGVRDLQALRAEL
jgi:hypothetical protein